MRMLLWGVTLVGLGCSKSADIEAVQNAPESEQPRKYCELAKSADDEEVKTALVARVRRLSNVDAAPDETSEDVECLPKALAGVKSPPDIAEELTRMHFKRSAVASLTALYDALPAAKKKDHVLLAFSDFSKGEGWTKSANVAAPLLLAELDKLGGTNDPKFFTALVGAYAMAPDKAAAPIKERYAKLAADPRMSAAWIAHLRDIGRYGDLESWKRYKAFMHVAVAELAARDVTLDQFLDSEAVLKVCAGAGADCSAASGLNEASKQALRACVNFNSSYDWAAPGKEFLAKLGGPNSDPVTLVLDDAANAARDQALVDHRNGKRPEDTSKTHPIRIDETNFPLFLDTVNKLVAMGPSVIPKLVELSKTTDPLRSRAAAHALAKLDPARLAKETTALLDQHDDGFRPDLSPQFGTGPAASGGLRALATVDGDAATNTILRALSSRDPEISAFATETIKKRLERDAAIDALFKYMATKDKYGQPEIDSYVGLVTSYGGAATGALVKNLEALLAAAGKPETVFWAHKVVAFTALKNVGTRSAADVIKKYASDPGGFVRVQSRRDKAGKDVGTPSKQNVTFKELTDAALKAVSTRE
ncbi:MAG TPA: hypothetical protein VFQ53_06270 [Kofleriaceae bacterium]|nr:hypothetical protein [Kofleriaceae bacterium]